MSPHQLRLVSISRIDHVIAFRRGLAFVCIFLLLFPGCGYRRVVTAQPESPAREKAPKDLSEYIRTVMKLSYGERHSGITSESASGVADSETTEPAVQDSAAAFADRLQSAIDSLQAGAYLTAFDQLDALEKLAPDNPQVQIQLANLWEAWGNYPNARVHAERAVTLLPGSDAAWELLGRASLHTDDYAAAARAYSRALEVGAETAVRQANLGFALLETRTWSEAEAHLRRALELDAGINEAHNNLAVTLAYLGKRDEALAEFAKVNEPAVAWNNLGVVLREQGLCVEATAAFRQALTLRPDYQRAELNLAGMSSYLPPPSTVLVRAFGSEPAPAPTKRSEAASAPVAPPVATNVQATDADAEAEAQPENHAPAVVAVNQADNASALPKSVSIRWSDTPSGVAVVPASWETLPAATLKASVASNLDLATAPRLSDRPTRLYTAPIPDELRRIAESVLGIAEPKAADPLFAAPVDVPKAASAVLGIETPSSDPYLSNLSAEPESDTTIRALRWQDMFRPGVFRPRRSGLDSNIGMLTLLLVCGLAAAFISRRRRRPAL